jgi:transposase
MKLTKEEIESLRTQHKKSRDKRVCDRIKAVLLINDGYSYEEIANILLLDDSSIRRHIEEYLNYKKLTTNYKGSDSKLNVQQTLELVEYLKSNIFMNVKPIIEYIKTKYQIEYTKSGITMWLKQHKFSYKKPHAIPAKINQEKQNEFINRLHVLKNAGHPLYFLDATHPEHQSKLNYGWIYKGDTTAIQTTATQTRVHIFGALSYPSNEITIIEDKTINSQSVISILEKLKFKHPYGTTINCILDNAKYQKSYIVKEYLIKNPNINLHYLPPYSPNLNLIERVWKFMHKHVTNNCYYEHFDNFRYSILSFLNNIGDFKSELQSLLTFKFQKLNYNLANFVK